MRCEVSENLKILAHGSSIGFSNEKSASVYKSSHLKSKPTFRTRGGGAFRRTV
jgi:hypothetical protein